MPPSGQQEAGSVAGSAAAAAIRSLTAPQPACKGQATIAAASQESAWRPTNLNDQWAIGCVCMFLAALVWIVFGQTVHHGFVNFDDDVYVCKNPKVLEGLRPENIAWAFTHVHSSNWHPLTWLSHILDCQIYGLNPAGPHLTNILLHTATVILLFLVLRGASGGTIWPSAFVAAVFAIHPLRVESVAWIAERKDVLSGLFFMLTIAAYLRYARLPWSPMRYGLVIVLFALGLMCKPMLATLPFALLLLDFWPLQRLTIDGFQLTTRPYRLWPLLKEKIPLLVFSTASSAIALFAQSEALSSLPLSTRIGNALVSCVIYLRQMFCPFGLAVFYPHPESSLPFWKVAGAFLLLLAISAGAIACWRKQPWFLFGWLWYLLMLVPVIGILQVGAQAHADRYTYLPQIGLYVLLTRAVMNLCAGRRHCRMVLGGLATVILVAFAFCARNQTAYWRNSESLWTHTLTCTTGNLVGHINLGNALLENGNIDDAMAQYQKALQIKPDDPDANVSFGYGLIQKQKLDDAILHFQRALAAKPNYPQAYNDLGNVFAQKGKTDEAIALLQKALQIKPDYAEACYNLANAFFEKGARDEAIVYYQKVLQIRPDYAEACFNLGNTYFQMGQVDDAISYYHKALKIRPNYTRAAYNLATALLQKGDLDKSILCFQKIVERDPNQPEFLYSLASALLRTGRIDQGEIYLQQALQIKPDYPEALNDLAWELATAPEAPLRNGGKAVELAQRANQLASGKDLDILGTLAAAYAEAGRFHDAIRSARRAIESAQATGQQEQVTQFIGHLKLYEAGLPFHQEIK